MNTITDWLEHWSVAQPEKRLYTFLGIDGQERESYTYRSFFERSTALAIYLSEKAGLRNGDRVLLVYPPGLEIIAAFFACARIGVIAVPVYAPSPISLEAGLAKLKSIARDCEAKAALTTSGFLRSHRLTKQRLSLIFNDTPMLLDRGWLTTDDVQGFGPSPARQDPNPVLFLQYTSGSTSDPKGVIVSHRNVIANGQSANPRCPIGVSWLPQYHDMGFIGYYMYPVILGGECYGFSPLDFLRRPALWMEAISRVRATSTSAPTFRVRLLPPRGQTSRRGASRHRPQFIAVHDERRRASAAGHLPPLPRALPALWPPGRGVHGGLRLGGEHTRGFAPRQAHPYRQQTATPAGDAARRVGAAEEQQPDPAGQLREAT